MTTKFRKTQKKDLTETDIVRDASTVSREVARMVAIQARGALKKEVLDHLRSKRRMRRSRHASEHGQSRGTIVDAIAIRERPAEAEDRAIPGHWEGDLLSGGKNSYMATLVERHSRFLMLIKVPSKETEAVVAALKNLRIPDPSALTPSQCCVDRLSRQDYSGMWIISEWPVIRDNRQIVREQRLLVFRGTPAQGKISQAKAFPRRKGRCLLPNDYRRHSGALPLRPLGQ